ncbi:DNA annealing helicase and endonuclease ZRANB3 isoform X2 [Tripterygium wilfordii]|uniref:DNA annealing helicase and endonuclease ZRANB3 isoform X2 n=1 Tax=Tripterygium wilfordii TaxID=458696 RepID=UPI0018F8182B|nr:DNA annealing helicase and endonuclease ZRANB3 isoform X2 [Tripterygium wilfordii]
MLITEEQRKRAEANRVAALAKRKALEECTTSEQNVDPWRLFKCTKVSGDVSTRHPKSHPNELIDPVPVTHLSQSFRVKLEICSPDSFSATPEVVEGFEYPGDEECLQKLSDCLADVVPSHYTQNHIGGKACVYKLRDYDAVLNYLKNYKGLQIDAVPFQTLNVVERLSHSFILQRWEPCRPEHLHDEKVNELMEKLPKKLLATLLPFQLDGLRFGLRRGGRCLIADEMGLGKTLQAIAIAGCFINEGPILVVCPAILRFSWAEELERWLPFCLPSEIHLVFGHRNNPASLTKSPRVVVISYKMLHILQKSILEREWALMIVDESHHVRCSKKKSESGEVKSVLDVAARVKRTILLSGTPSLSRPFDIFHQINTLWPGLLGKTKYDFAKTYCAVNFVQYSQGKNSRDFSKGTRLEELNVLLKQTVMIRRLKEHVLVQLPPKRRQIITLMLKKSDIALAKAAIRVVNGDTCQKNDTEDQPSQNSNRADEQLSNQEIGIAKLSGFRQWLSIHPLVASFDGTSNFDMTCTSQKMIIFAHHHKVLDGVQEIVCEKGIAFVRIDGRTLARDRQSAVLSFRSSPKVKIAIVGITAGGVGLDFSSAQHVVFLEMPQSPSLMLQAEDRAHRRGQRNAVNIYIFCAMDTVDERHWQYLNMSLHRVSSTTDGKYDSVEGVSYLEMSGSFDTSCEEQIFDNSRCDKSPSWEEPKLPEYSVAQDIPNFEVYDGLASNQYSRFSERSKPTCSVTLIEDIHMKEDIVPNESGKKFLSEENTEGLLSEAEIGILGDFSVCKPGEASENKYQLDKEHSLHPHETMINDGGPLEPNECSSKSVDLLRFEVSQYTGRIHLYSCIPGVDLRPRPLFESFRPEELGMIDSAPGNDKEAASPFFKDSPRYRHSFLTFINEWNKLRPIDRKKLLGKPLQLPLTAELCYLNESINHDRGGLLRGKSKRRTTPFYEISQTLPSNADWRKVRLFVGYSKKEKEYMQGWTLMGEPLCKLCQTPCKDKRAKTPEFFEDLFCNLDCCEEYRLRTSNRYLRQELFQVEHGVCSKCQLDCHQLVKIIKPLSLVRRREYIKKVAPNLASRKSLLDKLVSDPSEGNAWHADHIVPVYQGGGECRLENMRTLCVTCHADVTAAQQAERKSTRARAKKNLKDALNNLKNVQDMKRTRIYKVQRDLEIKEDMDDDDLLVVVPGSAYSGDQVATSSEDLHKSSEAKSSHMNGT